MTTNSAVDIGSTTQTTLGTITTGTWNATVLAGQYGGTGVANTGKTITLGGNISTDAAHTLSGAFASTFTFTAGTSVTFPTSGTLATVAGTIAKGTQTEVDFGSTPVYVAEFTITDANVTSGSYVFAQAAYVAPTGKSLNDLEFDCFECKTGSAAGSFTLRVTCLTGLFANKLKINYFIG